MAERPGFTFQLDPKKHKFKSVIGNYVEREFVNCGIASCNTAHGKGYIVATEDGRETRIGKDCGKKIFGIEFDHEAKRFERDKTAAEDREALYSFSFKVDEIEERIRVFRSGAKGAQWMRCRLQALTTLGQGVPPLIITALGDLARTRSSRVVRYRALTALECQHEEARLGRALGDNERTAEEFVADIRGIEAFYPEYDLRHLIAVELEDKLGSFKDADIDSLGHVQLRIWAKWVANVDSHLERVEEALEYGGRLLSAENLGPLMVLLTSRGDQKSFKTFLRTLA